MTNKYLEKIASKQEKDSRNPISKFFNFKKFKVDGDDKDSLIKALKKNYPEYK